MYSHADLSTISFNTKSSEVEHSRSEYEDRNYILVSFNFFTT
jgi:hypothetical protein